MRLKVLLVLFLILSYSQNVGSSELHGLKINFNTGFSYINSKDLNTVTQGMNAGYGTDFKNIHMPMLLNFAMMLDIGRSSIGIESGYEFANRSSYSTIYNFVETINYSGVPFGLKYQYELYKAKHLAIIIDAATGIMFLGFNMNNKPSIAGDEINFNSYAKAWYLTSGIGSTYYINDVVGINASFKFRYSKSSDFRYSSDDGRHNSGDEVRFSDGSHLTMNLLGLQFLLGLVLNWSL